MRIVLERPENGSIRNPLRNKMQEIKIKLDAEEIAILLAIDPDHHFPEWTIEDAIICGIINQIRDADKNPKKPNKSLTK